MKLKNTILVLSAFALAEFLAPYAEASGEKVEAHKNKIILLGEKETKLEPEPMAILKLALSYGTTNVEKRAIIQDFRLFLDRERVLASETEPEEDEDLSHGLSEEEISRFFSEEFSI